MEWTVEEEHSWHFLDKAQWRLEERDHDTVEDIVFALGAVDAN